jgi:acyl-CoA reductase-like NAD-dependent aldehyde dehydrogenase
LDPDLRALQDVRDALERAHAAKAAIAHYDQAATDRLCEAMAEAGARAAYDLAKLAVEETGIGRAHYKVLKNLFGSRGVWESIRHEKTVGVISRDAKRGVIEVATPAGVIAAIIPTTNPTSTALGKAMISVKGRNAIVMSPHPRSKRCIGETAEVLRRAIERAGGPPDLVQSLPSPTIESTGALMKDRRTDLILATGGTGLVRAAYSSGKPAYGVGPGNVPVYVDRSADVEEAAKGIVRSQSFDNATFCCSEQALVLDRPIADRMLAAMQARGAHLCNADETRKLEAYCNRGGMMNPDVVGVDPALIAQRAGFTVPPYTSLLLAHQGGVGKDHPLSIEVLCPLLSVHVVDGWEEGCRVSTEILHFGGLGHTIGVWAMDERVLEAWFAQKPASRIVANGPTSEGAVGYSTNLVPSLSLGCGPQAGNITSDNVTARHLLNIKRVGFPKSDWEEIYVRDMALAAEFSGETAPRGSGLPGDPALRGARPASSPSAAPAPPFSAEPSRAPGVPVASWAGNPSAAVHAAPRRGAPTFTRAGANAGSGGTPRAEPAASRPATNPSPAPRSAGPYAGAALSAGEIRDMMANAGSGCPLGPCKGCPHHEIRTGACMA